jgi:hypothetical protein
MWTGELSRTRFLQPWICGDNVNSTTHELEISESLTILPSFTGNGKLINQEPSFSQPINRGNSWGKQYQFMRPQATDHNIQEGFALFPPSGEQTIQEPPISSAKNPAPHPTNPNPRRCPPPSPTRAECGARATGKPRPRKRLLFRGIAREQEPDPRSRVGFGRGPKGAGSVPGAARWGMCHTPWPLARSPLTWGDRERYTEMGERRRNLSSIQFCFQISDSVHGPYRVGL